MQNRINFIHSVSSVCSLLYQRAVCTNHVYVFPLVCVGRFPFLLSGADGTKRHRPRVAVHGRRMRAEWRRVQAVAMVTLQRRRVRARVRAVFVETAEHKRGDV